MQKTSHKQCQRMQFLVVTMTFGLIMSLLGCNARTRLSEQLVGGWTNVDLRVSINHGSKMDSAYLFEVPEGHWESILKIKPILTKFQDDGVYSSEYRALNDSLIRQVEGKWEIIQDSLILIEQGTATLYHVKITNSEVTFSAWLDWDQDGESDDLYTGRQRKVVEGK